MTPNIHAKFRYATRILGMNFKEERLYRDWQKKNEEEDVRIKNEILDVFNSSEFVYEGKIGETNDISKYYVNLDKMITFVIDCKNNCIITCYDIFFDMGDEVDKQTAKILLKEIRKLQKKKETEQEKIAKYISCIDFNITTTKNEIERIEYILKGLKFKLNNLQEQKTIKLKETDELDYNIEKLSTKLCYSIQLKNDWMVR